MSRRFPKSLSAETCGLLEEFYVKVAGMPQIERYPQNVEEWDAFNASVIEFALPFARSVADPLGVSLEDDVLGGVNVTRITPVRTGSGKRILVYVHGGGYTLLSSRSALALPSLMAAAARLPVISIDYTLAPRGSPETATGEVAKVFEALVDDGHDPQEIGVFGDSAGGGLATAATLMLRDNGRPLPGALYLVSPWVDLTGSGDTNLTLSDADPTLSTDGLRASADAYVGDGDPRHPYASPVFGDFNGAFPATLIQAGTREILLSDAVRLYNAIRRDGGYAELDIYEGMPHVWQVLIPQAEETLGSVRRAAAFFDGRLA